MRVLLLCAVTLWCGTLGSSVYKHAPTVKHLEEVTDFRLSQSTSNQFNAPHGDSITITYKAYGESFTHHLYLDHNTWATGATIEFRGNGHGNVKTKPVIVSPESRSYITAAGTNPVVSAYVYNNNTVHAVVVSHDEVYTLHSIPHPNPPTANPHARKLVIYKESDVIGGHHHNHSIINLLKDYQHGAKNREKSGARVFGGNGGKNRQLLQVGNPSDPRHTGVEYWSGCWTGQESPKTMTVGIAVDTGYWNKFASLDSPDKRIEADIAEIVAWSNLIYGQQMNVFLSVVKLIVYKNVGNGSPSWNQVRPCRLDSGGTLDVFRSWRALAPQNDEAGLWHLMTDCFPAPGVVGIAYLGVLCSRNVGAGLTSYLNSGTNKGTWKTFAHEIGHNFQGSHSFEEGQGKTGGIMDYGNGTYKGVYQFNTKYRKTEICKHVDTVVRSKTGSKVCFLNGKGNGSLVQNYQWKISSTEKWPCSVPCGNGTQISKVFCVDDSYAPVSQTLCDPKTEPVGTVVRCNTAACTPTACSSCVNNCCSKGCETSSACVTDDKRKDAGFKQPRGKYTYLFRGADYTRFTDTSITPDPGFPRKINISFPTLSFQSDIDAAVVREDGDIFLFKGNQYVRCTADFVQNNGYPKLISDGFKGMSFASGVDAAISFAGGAWFFKGDQYVEYIDDQTRQAKAPMSLSNLGIAFRDRIDAAVSDWNGNVAIYRNGEMLVYKIGIGQVTPPQPVLTIGNPGEPVICPSNCVDCTNSTFCLLCANDYKPSVSNKGQCIPNIYALDLPFDNKEYDKTQFIAHNLLDTAWNRQGNTGGGLLVKPSNYMDLQPVTDTFPEFSMHLWINVNQFTTSQQLCIIEFTNGVIANWTLVPGDLEGRGLLSQFRLGDSIITGLTPVVPGLWKHIHADLIAGNLRVSVDGGEDRLPYSGQETEWSIKQWRLGAGIMNTKTSFNSTTNTITTSRIFNTTALTNGVDAVLDAFHIDILVPQERDPPPPPGPLIPPGRRV